MRRENMNKTEKVMQIRKRLAAAGASKAVPAFDVIDYGQEDYVFGSETQEARHWDKYLLEVLEQNEDTLPTLFNNG